MADFDFRGYDLWLTTPPDERDEAPWGELHCARGHRSWGRDYPHRTCWQCIADDWRKDHPPHG